jgi:hypothetical protein
MKALYFIIVLAIFAGCSPCERLARRCPPNVIVKDSIIIKETIKYKPRFIYDTIPADTVKVERIVQVEKPIDIDRISAVNKYAEAEAGVTASRLWLELRQKDQVITHMLDSAEKEITYWREQYNEKDGTVVVKQRYIPKFYHVAAWYGACLTIALLLYIVVRKTIKWP